MYLPSNIYDQMGRTVFDCTKSVLVLQLLRKASANKVAIQAKADQAAANQAAALKAADEQARLIQVKADKVKANQDRADQVASDRAAATATAARNAQVFFILAFMVFSPCSSSLYGVRSLNGFSASSNCFFTLLN